MQLTEEGHKALKERAESLDISMSEIFERWARGFSIDEYDKEEENFVAETISKPVASSQLDVETILRSLAYFSRYQIGRIALACLGLLMINSRKPEGKNTIADLVSDCREATLAVFIDIIRNAEKRVEQIIEGDKPTKKELGLLVGVLPVSREELMEMYSREFGCNNESTQGSICDC